MEVRESKKKGVFPVNISPERKVSMDQRKFREWIHMSCFYLLSPGLSYGFTVFTIQQKYLPYHSLFEFIYIICSI